MTKEVFFIKSQALGNDFVIIDNRDALLNLSINDRILLLDRKYGVGADELLILEKSEKADVFMRIYNADGTEAEACGNGTRACAKLLFNELKEDTINIETIVGILECKKADDLVSVKMSDPIFEWDKIPLSKKLDTSNIDLDVLGLDKNIFKRCMCSNVGNPHLIVLLNDKSKESLDNLDLEKLGAKLENDILFPQKINVEFIQILSPNEIRARVWERGTGETLACGSGSCGIATACIYNKLTNPKVKIIMKGGELAISYDDNGLIMTGDASKVFEGKIII